MLLLDNDGIQQGADGHFCLSILLLRFSSRENDSSKITCIYSKVSEGFQAVLRFFKIPRLQCKIRIQYLFWSSLRLPSTEVTVVSVLFLNFKRNFSKKSIRRSAFKLSFAKKLIFLIQLQKLAEIQRCTLWRLCRDSKSFTSVICVHEWHNSDALQCSFSASLAACYDINTDKLSGTELHSPLSDWYLWNTACKKSLCHPPFQLVPLYHCHYFTWQQSINILAKKQTKTDCFLHRHI